MAAALFGVVVGGAISQIFSSDGKVAGPERPKETIGAATVPQSALPVDPLAPPLLSAGAVIPFEDLELDRSVLRDNFRGPWCIVFPESRSGRAGIEFPWLFGCHAAEAECETRRAAVEARRKELSSIGETKCVLAKPSISCYAMRSVSDTSLNRCFLHRADCESSRVRRAFYPGRNILAISKKCEEVRSAADAERRTASATFPVETHPWAEWYGQRIKFGITVAGKNGVLKVAIPVGYFEQVPGGAFNVRFEKDDKDCSGAVFGRRILWSCSYPRSDQEGMFFRVIYLGWLEPGGCLAIGNGFLLKDDGWLEFRGGWRAELLDCTTENAETCEKLRRQVSKDRRKAKAREDYHLDPGAAEGANAICAGPGRGLPVCDRPFAGIEGLPVWQEDRVEIDVTVVGAQWRGKVSFLAWEASSREWISVQTCNASSCSRVLDKNELGDTPVLAAQAQSKTHYTLGWVDYPHAMELQRRYAESCGAEAKTPTD